MQDITKRILFIYEFYLYQLGHWFTFI